MQHLDYAEGWTGEHAGAPQGTWAPPGTGPGAAGPVEPPRKAWQWATIGVLAGACAVGLAWGVTALTGSGTSAFTLRGTMELTGDMHGVITTSTGGPCSGTGGYSDIAAGTGVTVYDASGDVVATGQLGHGNTTGALACTFPITVRGVPTGSDFYQVEVSHRGKITASASDAKHGHVALKLGD